MKKILLTGATGLLGGRIYSYFKKNYDFEPVSRKESISQHEFSKLNQIHWSSSSNLLSLVKDKGIVIHTAGLNAQESATDPILSYEVNTLNTQRLVDACSKNEYPPIFIYLSTAHVYNANLSGIVSENSPCTNSHPYASSHKAAEDIVLHATKQNKINGLVLRLSNGFGYPLIPDTNCWMLLVNDLVRQGVVKNEMKLHSDGLQKRNFFSIEYFLHFLEHILELPYEKWKYDLINLGSETNCSVWEMALLIQFRLQTILRREVPLSRIENKPKSNESSFVYSIDRLKETISGVDEYQTKEIDQLISFCKIHFSV